MAGSIVCGIDDSSEARGALAVAAALAARLDLRLVLLHLARPAYPPSPAPMTPAAGPAPLPPYPSPEPEDEDAARVRDQGKRLLETVAGEAGAAGAELRVELGFEPADALRRVAADAAAEFLVVGSRGRGPAKAALLGSTSADLGGDAPCPVVVVSGTARAAEAGRALS